MDYGVDRCLAVGSGAPTRLTNAVTAYQTDPRIVVETVDAQEGCEGAQTWGLLRAQCYDV